MERLAGMRKVAQEVKYLGNTNVQPDRPGYYKTRSGTILNRSGSGEWRILAKGGKLVHEAIPEGNTFIVEYNLRSEDIEREYRAMQQAASAAKTPPANKTDSYFPNVNLGETKENYIERAKEDIALKKAISPYLTYPDEEQLGQYYDSVASSATSTTGGAKPAAKTRPAGGDSAKTQAARAATTPLVIKHPQKTKLEDIGGTYTYHIDDPSSRFSYFNSAKPGETGKVFDRNAVTVQQWNKAVAVLNDDKKVRVTSSQPTDAAPASAAGSAQAPQATTGGAAATQAPAEKTLNPTAVKNTEAILRQASTMRLAMKTAENERGRIRDMVEYLGKKYPQPLNLLAQLVVRKGQTYLESFLSREDMASDILASNRADLIIGNKQGKYSKYVRQVLLTLNNLYDQDYVLL